MLCSLGFAGFFRYNELSNILPAHLECHSDFLRIFVTQATNDMYREGNYVYIKRLNNFVLFRYPKDIFSRLVMI